MLRPLSNPFSASLSMDEERISCAYFVWKTMSANTSGKRVLVVDDEPKIVDVVASYLLRAGYAPVTAAGGAEALLAFEKERPALVILDLMLPDLSGEDVCRKLRARSRVPIIMLTAKAEDADAVRGLGLGADDYVVKPFSPRQLMARVEAVLRRSGGIGDPLARLLSFNDDDLLIDDAAGTVRKRGASVNITPPRVPPPSAPGGQPRPRVLPGGAHCTCARRRVRRIRQDH